MLARGPRRDHLVRNRRLGRVRLRDRRVPRWQAADTSATPPARAYPASVDPSTPLYLLSAQCRVYLAVPDRRPVGPTVAWRDVRA